MITKNITKYSSNYKVCMYMYQEYQRLFADDAKIYATLDINDDGVNLSDKLKCVEKWCSEQQLTISVKKCAVMHIHIGNKITGAEEPSFAIGSSALPVVDHVKDLGVIIDEQL